MRGEGSEVVCQSRGGAGRRSILQDQGFWPGNICFPSNQRGDFCLPRMPKSCGGWGRAGVGLETSNAFPHTLGDRPDAGLGGPVSALTPCQIREKLSLPINFSVSFSQPCCVRGLGSWMGPTAASSPPTSSHVHRDSLLWVRESGPGPWHHNNTVENNAHRRLAWRASTCQASWRALPYHISFIPKRTLQSGI